MNKAIYICASMALMLASCSNDETVELAKEKGISFRGMVGLNTRAQNTGTTELLDGKALYVTTFKPGDDGDLLYEETEYTYDGSVWVATPEQSWGGNDKLSFFLTYPKLDEWENGAELTKDNKTVTVTVDGDIPQQKDYLAVYLKDAAKTQQGAAVNANLQHVLSSVEIWAKNGNKAFQYKVKGIRICGANSIGGINFAGQFACSNTNTPKNYELTYANAITLGGDAKSIMGPKLNDTNKSENAILIPQTTTEWNGGDISVDNVTPVTGSYISVLINLTATAGAVIYPAGSTADQETYGWVSVPVAFNWTGGNKYVYTLDFSDGAGKVDPVNPGDAVNPGGKDPNKAEPILGGLIKFGLTVTQWNQDRNDVDLKDDSKFDATVDSWEDETTDDTILK